MYLVCRLLLEKKNMLHLGPSFRRLCDWIRQYAGEHYSWDVQLVLAKDEVPVIQIGKAGRLGWTTWLKSKPFERDAEDLVMSPSHYGVSCRGQVAHIGSA